MTTPFDVCAAEPTKDDLERIEQEQEQSWLLQIADDSKDQSVIDLRDQLIMVTKLVHDEELEEKKKWESGYFVSGGAINLGHSWTISASTTAASISPITITPQGNLSVPPGVSVTIPIQTTPHKADKPKSPFNKLKKLFGKEK